MINRLEFQKVLLYTRNEAADTEKRKSRCLFKLIYYEKLKKNNLTCRYIYYGVKLYLFSSGRW